jgi:hypothetical protein
MLKSLVAVALVGSLGLAAPALAQTIASPAPASDTTAAAQADNPSDIPPEFITGHNAATARSLHGQTVMIPESPPDRDVVTVIGRHRCRKTDQACVDRISAEIWTKYPKQIRALCTATAIHNVREGFVEAQLGISGVLNDRFTPATQRLCQYGDKVKKEEIAAKAAAAAPADPDPDALPKP